MPKAIANGIQISYRSHGEGVPLVLVMGLASQLVSWPEPLIELLVARGFRVIRFDNRDVGESTWFPDAGVPDVKKAVVKRLAGRPIRAPYTLSDMAGDSIGLLDYLGIESAHIAGVSMGGMIAQTTALEHPSRIQSLTSIMSTPGSVRFLVPKPHALKQIFTPPRSSRLEDVVDNRIEFFRRTKGDLPIDEAFIRSASIIAYERGYNPAAAARQLTAVLASGSRLAALSRMAKPTTVIHGAQDPLVVPEAGQAMAHAVPNARYVELAGMGHNLPAAHWERIADEIAKNAGVR